MTARISIATPRSASTSAGTRLNHTEGFVRARGFQVRSRPSHRSWPAQSRARWLSCRGTASRDRTATVPHQRRGPPPWPSPAVLGQIEPKEGSRPRASLITGQAAPKTRHRAGDHVTQPRKRMRRESADFTGGREQQRVKVFHMAKACRRTEVSSSKQNGTWTVFCL